MDHQAEFQLMVMEKLGKEAADNIDWSAPRVLCIAADFTKYDDHAVQQIGRNIELLRYRKFGDSLLLLELVNAVSDAPATKQKQPANQRTSYEKTVTQLLDEMDPEMNDLFSSLESYLMSLGDDVQRKDLKLYVAFKRLRNIACVIVQKQKLIVFVGLDPSTVDPVSGFTRDMRKIGHRAPGNLEISLTTHADLDRAKPLLQRSYDGS